MKPDTRRPNPVFADLDAAGLNLQAVFDVAELPADLQRVLPADEHGSYRQLLLIGHLGPTFWQQAKAAGMQGEDPLDAFTRTCVVAWANRRFPEVRHALLYPGDVVIGLQRLGKLAGWHHPSPFMVGVAENWGSWFAYRAVLAADTDLPPTPPLNAASPCEHCARRPCVAACPAQALGNGFDPDRCSGYRLAPGSNCRDQCLARSACPVGAAHRYGREQMAYHYGRSLATLAGNVSRPD